jgi:hypothetical protein
MRGEGNGLGEAREWKRKAEMINGRNREYEEQLRKDWVREKGDE